MPDLSLLIDWTVIVILIVVLLFVVFGFWLASKRKGKPTTDDRERTEHPKASNSHAAPAAAPTPAPPAHSAGGHGHEHPAKPSASLGTKIITAIMVVWVTIEVTNCIKSIGVPIIERPMLAERDLLKKDEAARQAQADEIDDAVDKAANSVEISCPQSLDDNGNPVIIGMLAPKGSAHDSMRVPIDGGFKLKIDQSGTQGKYVLKLLPGNGAALIENTSDVPVQLTCQMVSLNDS